MVLNLMIYIEQYLLGLQKEKTTNKIHIGKTIKLSD